MCDPKTFHEIRDGIAYEPLTCSACSGSGEGRMDRQRCLECGGDGELWVPVKVEEVGA